MENDPKKITDQERFDRNLESNLNDSEQQNLSFNKETNSFEIDINSEEGEEEGYIHPDPYDTSAPNGSDSDSDYDEANPYVGDEYAKDASLEKDIDKLGMHEISDDQLMINKKDERLARTKEDDRTDLDEEGYPKNNRS